MVGVLEAAASGGSGAAFLGIFLNCGYIKGAEGLQDLLARDERTADFSRQLLFSQSLNLKYARINGKINALAPALPAPSPSPHSSIVENFIVLLVILIVFILNF